ncbi:MAG: OadG family protein [Bacillota bacterium]|nr:OadG family protein [Bacillota bacterium]
MLDILKEGLFVTIFSMAIVFAVLEIISLLISLETYIINKFSGRKKKGKLNVNDIQIEEKQEDNLEIIAAITAALSMYTSLSGKQFKIKSIVRTKDSLNWRRA